MTTTNKPIRYRRKAKILSESGCLYIPVDSARFPATGLVEFIRSIPMNFKVARFER